jgi:hypothetical protein
VYAGVPTYLLGFIPLDDGQTLTLTHAGGFLESAGWTVTDDAGWLNEDPLLGVVGCIDRNQDVTVRVNTDGLAAGTYTATITFKFTTCATKTITVPVTVNVIEPRILGPLGIGIDKDLLKGISGAPAVAAENEYEGLTVQLLTNPEDMMDMQAIETDGCWDLVFQRGDELEGGGGVFLITGGTLNIQGQTEDILGGAIAPLSFLMAMAGGAIPGMPEDLGDNYMLMLSAADGDEYIGVLLADLPTLLDLIPALLGSSSGEEAAGTDINDAPPALGPNGGATNGEATVNDPNLVIPMKPLLKLLPSLMPLMTDLLSNQTIMDILKPLMELLPPIIIIMPTPLFFELIQALVPA